MMHSGFHYAGTRMGVLSLQQGGVCCGEKRAKLLPKDEYDQAVAEAKRTEALRLSADAAVVVAKADLERAEAVLRHSAAQGPGKTGETVIVRSPVSAKVLKRHRESAGVVNSGDPLLDVGDPGSLEVYAEVLSADAVKIRRGMPVLFERWGGETALQGKVRVVEPAGFTKVSSLGVEEQRVNVIVDFTSPVDMWQGLGDGYRLDASFVIWEGKDVLQVPASARFRKGESWALFAVENKRAKLREIEVGKRNGLQAEILSGIKEGEVVIVHPDDAIRAGVKVKVR
jgi:HlyD family secretion protein